MISPLDVFIYRSLSVNTMLRVETLDMCSPVVEMGDHFATIIDIGRNLYARSP